MSLASFQRARREREKRESQEQIAETVNSARMDDSPPASIFTAEDTTEVKTVGRPRKVKEDEQG